MQEICTGYKEKKTTSGQILQHVFQGDCGITILGILQDSNGHGPDWVS